MDCFHVNQAAYSYPYNDIDDSDEVSNSFASDHAVVDYGYSSIEDDDDDLDEEGFLMMTIAAKLLESVYFSSEAYQKLQI
jgi:hypothetical protein